MDDNLPQAAHETSTTDDDRYQTDSTDLFSPPTLLFPRLAIEFCNRCRWLHRASWMATELMLTFSSSTIPSVTLVPLDTAETSGRFRVWLYLEDRNVLLWDRKAENGFPELKILKQRLRDVVDSGRDLGHSDVLGK